MSFNKLIKLRDYLKKTHQEETDVVGINTLLNQWYYASGSWREKEATPYLEKYAHLNEEIETMEAEVKGMVGQLKALKVTDRHHIKRKEYLLYQIHELPTLVAISKSLIKEIKDFTKEVSKCQK